MARKPARKFGCIICGKPSIARKMCDLHYRKAKRSKSLYKYPKLSIDDSFDSLFKKSEGCWEWAGHRDSYGYGIFVLHDSKTIKAHRYAYQRHTGKSINGFVVMHLCDNPPCVNPSHLRLGTQRENNLDAASKGRTPHGEKHWNARLSTREVTEIRSLIDLTHDKIAAKFGVSRENISSIIRGRSRKRD